MPVRFLKNYTEMFSISFSKASKKKKKKKALLERNQMTVHTQVSNLYFHCDTYTYSTLIMFLHF